MNDIIFDYLMHATIMKDLNHRPCIRIDVAIQVRGAKGGVVRTFKWSLDNIAYFLMYFSQQNCNEQRGSILCCYCNGNELIYDQMKCLYNNCFVKIVTTKFQQPKLGGIDKFRKQCKWEVFFLCRYSLHRD